MDSIWQHVLDELNAPNSPYPELTRSQRAYLALTTPVGLVPGFALVTTKHALARDFIEKELAPTIESILSSRIGRPTKLAVSVDAHAEEHHEDPAPVADVAAAATAPTPEAQPTYTPPVQQAPPAQPAPPQMPPAQQAQPAAEEPAWKQQAREAAAQLDAAAGTAQQSPQQTYNTQVAHQYPPQDIPAPEPTWAETQQVTPPAAPVPTPPQQQPAPPQQPSAPQQQPTAPRDPLYVHPNQRLSREQPAHNPDQESTLNANYTFESFVIGSSNRFAHAAAVAVAESPANAFNPLFIWGGSGLGKTHLLHALGNYSKELQPGLRVKYVSSEEFTNDYINSVRDDRQESFKRRYRNLDILMVDDIQFLVGKEGTQEEFFHTFNALHQANKQIVLSSDRPPKQLTTLTDRLRTRFEGGLITDIQPPDLETRIAILSKKAQIDQTTVGRDVLELIATRFESSIRELEGALIRVTAYSSLINQPIDMQMAEVALRDIMPEAADVVITPEMILEATSEYFEFSIDVLRGSGKTRDVVRARQLAMYLCRELTELSLPKIGEAFGKDHSTVIHAVRKIGDSMSEDRTIYDQVQMLTQNIKNRGRAIPS
ncbi:chromosomal replication initiator protein DnaA [Corynebacterium sp. 13CS0277]|nr:chromosomal replication initiator protein DnaA [Corynebacterium sp. 13CS0277]